jgi:hypothetical protein
MMPQIVIALSQIEELDLPFDCNQTSAATARHEGRVLISRSLSASYTRGKTH